MLLLLAWSRLVGYLCQVLVPWNRKSTIHSPKAKAPPWRVGRTLRANQNLCDCRFDNIRHGRIPQLPLAFYEPEGSDITVHVKSKRMIWPQNQRLLFLGSAPVIRTRYRGRTCRQCGAGKGGGKENAGNCDDFAHLSSRRSSPDAGIPRCVLREAIHYKKHDRSVYGTHVRQDTTHVERHVGRTHRKAHRLQRLNIWRAPRRRE